MLADSSGYQVRQLSEAHRPQLLALLRQDPANNIFLIGSVAAFGVRARNLAFWGAFRRAGLAGVAMLHGENACFYAPESACLGQLLPRVSRAQNLSGAFGLMQEIIARLPARRLVWSANEFFCRLEERDFRPRPAPGVRLAGPADLDLLTSLYVQGEASGRLSREQVLEHVKRQIASARFHVMIVDGEIVCAAAAVAETEDTAMIVSVLTAPAARNRGHASAVVSTLCADLLTRGKAPHLFYKEDNDAAGSAYKRLGFTPIGRWMLARLTPIDQAPFLQHRNHRIANPS